MHHALEALERYIGEVGKRVEVWKGEESAELEEVFDYEKMQKLVDGLKGVLLPTSGCGGASLRADVVKKAGFELGEIRYLIR